MTGGAEGSGGGARRGGLVLVQGFSEDTGGCGLALVGHV